MLARRDPSCADVRLDANSRATEPINETMREGSPMYESEQFTSENRGMCVDVSECFSPVFRH